MNKNFFKFITKQIYFLSAEASKIVSETMAMLPIITTVALLLKVTSTGTFAIGIIRGFSGVAPNHLLISVCPFVTS